MDKTSKTERDIAFFAMRAREESALARAYKSEGLKSFTKGLSLAFFSAARYLKGYDTSAKFVNSRKMVTV